MKEKDTKLAPISLLRAMSRELDRLFEEPGWPLFRARTFMEPDAWAPDVDVFEKDNRLVTRVDLPGLRKEDITVEVVNGRLLITGERKREVEEKEENWYRSEREFGKFFRAVPMPENVKLDELKATFTDGVLEVAVPIAAKALPPSLATSRPGSVPGRPLRPSRRPPRPLSTGS
jgi:HSP20 family protein